LARRRTPLAGPARPLLPPVQSAALRDRLVAEVDGLQSTEEATDWAYRTLPAKNTLTIADADLRAVPRLLAVALPRYRIRQTALRLFGPARVARRIDIRSKSMARPGGVFAPGASICIALRRLCDCGTRGMPSKISAGTAVGADEAFRRHMLAAERRIHR